MPFSTLQIGRKTGPQARDVLFPRHLDAALVAIQAQAQVVQMTAGKARRGHGAQRAVGQHQLHGGAVIGVQHIVTDLVARCLVEGCQTAGHLGH